MSMSRFSLSSPFALFQSIVASDQEVTSSSTSSSSAINNSSTSLSLSPAASSQSASIFSEIHQQQQQQRQQKQAFKFLNASPISATAESTKQISKHLLELQREIKEEEDEIFADINSLINDRSNLYSSSFDVDDFEANGVAINGVGNLIDPLTVVAATITRSTATPTSADSTSNAAAQAQAADVPFAQFDGTDLDAEQRRQERQCCEQKHQQEQQQQRELLKQLGLQKDQDDDLDEEEEEQPYEDHHHRRRHHNHHHHHNHEDQHQQLEQEEEQQQQQQHHEHQQHEQQQEQSFQDALQQNQQHRDIQELTSNLPKPCVFFLEGNCRRSDCKFSHDLSSIICKYWIEGFCFKGEMCPFSHSLTPKGNESGLMNDENDAHLNEKALNPTFAIESETDFPSLPLDAPANLSGLLGEGGLQLKNSKQSALTKTIIKNQILSSNPTVVFKTTKKKRKKG